MMYEIRKRGNGDIYRIRYEWLVIGFADKTKSGTELQQFKTLTAAENFCKKHCAEYQYRQNQCHYRSKMPYSLW